jgi:hypothetical protein
MKLRRKVIIAGFVVIAVLGISASMFTLNPGPKEAYYQGRSASYWLDQWDDSNPKQQEVLMAFREMGTNAFPVLLDAFDYKEDSPVIFRLRQRLVSTPFVCCLYVLLPRQGDRSESATDVLIQAYGETHTQELLQWLKDPDMGIDDVVLSAVATHVGPANRDEVPILVAVLNRFSDGFDSEDKAMSLMCLSRIGPGASNAIPDITKACQSTDFEVRVAASWALWQVTGRTNMAVPVLQAALAEGDFLDIANASYDKLQNDVKRSVFLPVFIQSLGLSDEGLRISACDELRHYGSDAKEAMPVLLKAIHEPCLAVRDHAWTALCAIDPDTASKAIQK